jgi:lysophospholipase L1-like esterase
MRRIIITMAAAMMVIATVATPALAGERDGPVHIGLGDSVAAGSGANNSNTAYAPRLSRFLRSVDCAEGTPQACARLQFADYSVGGATSGDLISEQLNRALAEITARRIDGDPRNNVEFITITIGGNDLFQPVLEACGDGVNDNCKATITNVFGAYATNLAKILGTLRAEARGTEIAIMTYYNPLGACHLSHLAPLAELALEGIDGVQPGLNDLIRDIAAGVGGITVVETYGLLGEKDLVGADDCLHPADSGHLKIAKAFRRAMSS